MKKLSKSQEIVIKALKSLKKKSPHSGAVWDELIREGVPSKSLCRSISALERRGLVSVVIMPNWIEVRLCQ